ncbi:MAG: hypothetical protein JSV80_04420 [Acidobacteriota bacterium]|nr:MAG: hypothetical protein JSV80_04420 [Acidobacteriota bacterium]
MSDGVDGRPACQRLTEALERAVRSPDPWVLDLDRLAGRSIPQGQIAPVEPLVEALAVRPGLALVGGLVEGIVLEVALAAQSIVAEPASLFRSAGGGAHHLSGTPWRLSARVGPARALAFWLHERGWRARRALAAGLVDAVSVDLGGFSERWARAAASRSRALEALRLLQRSGGALCQSAALGLERALFALAFADEAPRRGARAILQSAPCRDEADRGS